MSSVAVSRFRFEALVPHSNQTSVSSPFGSASPRRSAEFVVTSVAERVVTSGSLPLLPPSSSSLHSNQTSVSSPFGSTSQINRALSSSMLSTSISVISGPLLLSSPVLNDL